MQTPAVLDRFCQQSSWMIAFREQWDVFFIFIPFLGLPHIRQRVAWLARSSGLEFAPRDLLWRCFFRKITMNFHSAWSASWTTICLCMSKIQPKSKLMQKYSKLQHLFAKRKGFHRFSRFEIDRKYLELQRAPLVFRGDIPNISKGYSKCGRCAVQLFCICSLVTPAQLRSVPKFS